MHKVMNQFRQDYIPEKSQSMAVECCAADNDYDELQARLDNLRDDAPAYIPQDGEVGMSAMPEVSYGVESS